MQITILGNSPGVRTDIHRVPELDGIRGLAILMVLMMHCFLFKPPGAIGQYIGDIINILWMGVDLFFVLSGYLITSILLETKTRPDYFRRFYIRRIFRIFPAYYSVLALVVFILPLVSPAVERAHLLNYLPYFIFHVQNWLFASGDYASGWGGIFHFWSLAIEEQFYLFWPLLVFYCNPRRLPWACLFIYGASVGYKTLALLSDIPSTHLFVNSFIRMDGLAAGALVASIGETHKELFHRWGLVIAGASMSGIFFLAPQIATSALPGAEIQTLAVIVFACLIAALRFGFMLPTVSHALKSKFFGWLGRYSYGIYLLHYVILSLVAPLVDQRYPELSTQQPNLWVLLTGGITVAICLPTAVAMSRYIEQPLLNFGHKLRP